MKLTWLGHASFLLEDSDGRKLLTDPFDETVGYTVFKGRVDVITISHNHFDHNYIKIIGNEAKIVDKVGFFNECDIPIRGIPSFHDEVKGAKRGENIIFIIEMDGYKICHLGDLGHLLTSEDLDMIGDVDILLIPVGGNYTISGSEAANIANSIQSKITIPMHYKTPRLTFPLDGVETFLTHMKSGERINSNSIIIEDILDEDKNKVLILTT
ncbi:MBL fold metallo-hydrolase [Clostridium sp. Marseille-QA1073]